MSSGNKPPLAAQDEEKSANKNKKKNEESNVRDGDDDAGAIALHHVTMMKICAEILSTKDIFLFNDEEPEMLMLPTVLYCDKTRTSNEPHLLLEPIHAMLSYDHGETKSYELWQLEIAFVIGDAMSGDITGNRYVEYTKSIRLS